MFACQQFGGHCWRYGDEGCWGQGLGFWECCGGNSSALDSGSDLCWDEVAGFTFQRCCRSPKEGSPRHQYLTSRAKEELEKCHDSFSACVTALAESFHFLDLAGRFLGDHVVPQEEFQHFEALKEEVIAWHSRHLDNLSKNLQAVLASYSRTKPLAAGVAPRVAVLIACTPGSAGSPGCTLGAGLWQCYAHRHSYHFVYDTAPYPARPKLHFTSPTAGGKALPAIDADFGMEALHFLNATPSGIWTDAHDFKWWQRWYAARRHLPFFDVLLVVDADTAVFPACTGIGLLEALNMKDGGLESSYWPGAATRDARPGEDLNGGVMVLTRSPWGRLYLELLLAKSRWPVDLAGSGGWCHSRQGAELHSFLELMALEQAATQGLPLNQSIALDCLRYALPEVFRRAGGSAGTTLSVGCLYPAYLSCWRRAATRIAGPPGHRITRHAWLVDPAMVDLNYRPWSQEPRYAIPEKRHQSEGVSERLLPLARGAFLWHYVGLSDKVGCMLRDFGLQGMEDVLDCEQLAKRFDAWTLNGSGGASGCSLGGSSKPCPLGFEAGAAWARGHPPFGC